MDRERLARTLIRAAMSFYDRAPWRHLAADLWVAVRVPDGRVVRLGMEVDPRAVDELVVGSNGASFATLRSSLPR